MNDEQKFVNEDHGIFTNEQEALDGLRQSAEAVGIDPDMVAPENVEESRQPQFYAKENCRTCWGRGIMYYVPSPVKAKTITVGGQKRILPANELSEVWSTCKPEPPGLKLPLGEVVEQNGQEYMGIGRYVYCSCVRVLDDKEGE